MYAQQAELRRAELRRAELLQAGTRQEVLRSEALLVALLVARAQPRLGKALLVTRLGRTHLCEMRPMAFSSRVAMG